MKKLIKTPNIPKKFLYPLSICLCVLTVGISVFSLKNVTYHYKWIGVSCVCLSFYFFVVSRRTKLKVIWINLAAIICAVTLFEIYTTQNEDNELKGNKIVIEDGKDKGFMESSDILGYAPKKDNWITLSQYFNDKLLYTKTYTIDKNGLRDTSAPDDAKPDDGCVVFFGCSYTYGQGVKDNETMPYYVGEKSLWKYKVYNFGFQGYGPHQMLSALEHKLVENIVECEKPPVAIFQTHYDHALRVAGFKSWDFHGPKYILKNGAEVEFVGNFDTEKGLAGKFKTFKMLSRKQLRNSDELLDLYVEIVTEARNKFENQYPGSSFHVMYWDDPIFEAENKKILSRFAKQSITIHLISDILTEYKVNKMKYMICPEDEHPNPQTYALLANYVLEAILP